MCGWVRPLSAGTVSTITAADVCENTLCERVVLTSTHTHTIYPLPPFHPTPTLPHRSQWTGHKHADATGLQLKTLQTTLRKLQSGEISKVELSKCL